MNTKIDILSRKKQIPIFKEINKCLGDNTLSYKDIVECMFLKYKGKIFDDYLPYSHPPFVVDEEHKKPFISSIMGLLIVMNDGGILDSRWSEDDKGIREYWIK